MGGRFELVRQPTRASQPVIPAQAVQTGPEKRFVFVVGDDGKVSQQPVTLAHVDEGMAVVDGLRPGARIPPHAGVMNARLICHLPLIVPQPSGFRVGNETRAWEEGKLLVFDDSIEHEAWNDSAEDRVVLIFDIWRPELSEADRRAVTAIF